MTKTDRPGIGLVVALGLLSMFGPVCLDMYLPALPDLPEDLRSTTTMAQLTLSACIVGLSLGQLVVGPWSDRVGRRLPLLLGLVLFVATSVGCALTTSMPVLIGLRVLQGAAGAAGLVVGRAVVADRFSGAAAASLYSTIAAINGLAPILAPLVGGQILRVGDWRTVFWVLAGMGVALLMVSVFWIGESLPPERRGAASRGVLAGFAVLVRDRVFVGLVLTGTMVTAAMFGYISASPFLLQQGFGLSEQQFSLSFASNAVGIVLCTQLGRVLTRRFSITATLAVGVAQCLTGAALLALAVFASLGLVWVLVALLIMVSAVGTTLPAATALAMDRHREIAGAASAVVGTAQFLLGAITAPLAGLGDRTAGHALAITALVAAGLAVLAALSVGRSAAVVADEGQARS